MKNNSKIAEKVRKEVSENFARDFVSSYLHVPVTEKIHKQIAKKIMDYCDKMEIELTNRIIEEDYDCEKCNDTGLRTKVVDAGSHFGGGIREDHVEFFCNCETGLSLKRSGYKLRRY